MLFKVLITRENFIYRWRWLPPRLSKGQSAATILFKDYPHPIRGSPWSQLQSTQIVIYLHNIISRHTVGERHIKLQDNASVVSWQPFWIWNTRSSDARSRDETITGRAEKIRKLSGRPLVYREYGFRRFLGPRPSTRWPHIKIQNGYHKTGSLPCEQAKTETNESSRTEIFLMQSPIAQNYCTTHKQKSFFERAWGSMFCHSLSKTTTRKAGGYEKSLVYNFKRPDPVLGAKPKA